METSRRANRDGQQTMLKSEVRQENALVAGLNENKLAQLLAFVSRLQQTPAGAADLQYRIKHFGECQRFCGETSGQFYARLRHWLDRDTPETKSPLSARRQTGD
jgi:hypothetical protein